MNIKQKFRSSIRRGTGETHILIKENPTIDFSREIIEGALFNFAYDQQCEGSRDFYIAELIELSAQRNEILPVIYEALKNEETEDWSTEHLFDIIAIFAKQGDEKAKQTVYECFDKYAQKGDWFGDEAIVKIDSLKGLIYVAEKKGKFLKENPNEWESSFYVDNFQEENLQIDVYGELKRVAQNNSNIKKYLEAIEENKFERAKWKKPNYDYQFIKEKIDDNRSVYISTYAIEHLSNGDVKNLADDFLQEKGRLKQANYLSVFSRVKFPYNYQPILKLAKAKNRREDRLVEFAVESLRFFTEKDIRQFAIEKLSKTNRPDVYIELLIGNYRKGDWRLLKSIAEKYKNEDIIHSLAVSYINIYRANPTKECKEPLEAIYNKLTCGLHRTDVVEILIENKILSEQIRREIQFDCNEATRRLFDEYLKSQN